MILIFSINEDVTTDLVIDWIKYYNHLYTVLISSDFSNKMTRLDLITHLINMTKLLSTSIIGRITFDLWNGYAQIVFLKFNNPLEGDILK